jgi:hypothetical protein
VTNSEQSSIDLERVGWEALAAARDVVFYRDMFLDDGLMIFPSGVFRKTDALQGLASACSWDTQDPGHFRFCSLGDDGEHHLCCPGSAYRPAVYSAFMSSTYVFREGARKFARRRWHRR